MINKVLDFVEKILILLQKRKYDSYRKTYNIDPSFRFNGKDVIFYGDGEINIGQNSYIGHYSTIQAAKGYKVSIGKGCSISHNVRMYTSSKKPDYDFSNRTEVPEKQGNIIIGNYVWIGANVFINPGVTIGDNSVIGANAVITKNIEPFCIYAGVPAKLIRKKNINA